MGPKLEAGACVLDFHSSGFLQDDWFDLVLVLRADTNVLWGRVEKRHYTEAKIKGNVEAEIFQTCLDEAREAFEETEVKILDLQHNTLDDSAAAAAKVKDFLDNYMP